MNDPQPVRAARVHRHHLTSVELLVTGVGVAAVLSLVMRLVAA